MTQVNGYGYTHPSPRPPAPPPAPPQSEGALDVLRGLGIAACLVLGGLVLPCTVLALADGSLVAPEPVRLAAQLLSGAFIVGILALAWWRLDRDGW